jgi:hypothetical protein
MPTPEQISAALAFSDALPGCSDTQRHMKVLADAYRSLDPSAVDQSIELAAALEQQRALKIVADVRALRMGKGPDEMLPTVAESFFDLACEEIEVRLRTEEWTLLGVAMPLPALPSAAELAEHNSQMKAKKAQIVEDISRGARMTNHRIKL